MATPWRHHVCGLYYVSQVDGRLDKTYLPQVDIQTHTSILAATSRTALTQTFLNPSDSKGIKEVRYIFPLYDGVSVIGFTCHIGDRTIVGEVKEKDKARAVFNEAVAKGQTAGLLEQLPDAADVFTTTVGNVPPGAKVVIRTSYLGELKHDMEVDGIRFTLPNIISPRYGAYPGSLMNTTATDAYGGRISITVDAEMAEGSFIQQIRSPSHPIAVSMGTTTFAPNDMPSMNKASATLSLGSAQLDTDFVLQVISKDTGTPKAILETHPRILNQRALMATLVPKFSLPADRPEVVFVCDRSGSMSGRPIELAKQALKVFLKSLPLGVKFNLCSFGSNHSFLWGRSASYSQQTLDEAIRHVEGFSANFGGTEMLPPLKATLERRYQDMPLEVMVLTDGDTWGQRELFSYLNEEIGVKKAPIRVFTLGIGDGVSSALIEGVARAGKGFAQAVADGEKMDSKVVRMLKGALSPHVDDYTLEVKYSEELDDFELVEKVTNSLNVKLKIKQNEGEKKEEPVGFQSQTMRTFFTDYNQKKPISLFDTSVDLDREDSPVSDETGESRYAHLPGIPNPKIIQSPQDIPSLFPFIRTTVYLLLSPDAPSQTPKSVVLRGNSKHGPLELEIPVQVLDVPGEMVHQLAAKKTIAELEEGRGWLPEAKDSSTGKLLKETYDGRFEEIVEREAVRLGVQFQVGGKWCSFVAVEKENRHQQENDYEWLDVGDNKISHAASSQGTTSFQPQKPNFFSASNNSPHPLLAGFHFNGRATSVAQPTQAASISTQMYTHTPPYSQPVPQATGFGAPTGASGSSASGFAAQSTGFSLAKGTSISPQGFPSFGTPPAPAGQASRSRSSQQTNPFSHTVASGNEQNAHQAPIGAAQTFGGSIPTQSHAAPTLFGSSSMARPPPPPAPAPLSASSNPFAPVPSSGTTPHVHHSLRSNATASPLFGSANAPIPPPPQKPKTDDDILNALVALQTFEGYWDWNAELFNATSLSADDAEKLLGDDERHDDEAKRALATAFAVAFFETRLSGLRESWELIVDKAKGWLGDKAGDLVERAKGAL